MFAKQAKELEEMGCDSICIKDMAGLLHPYDAFEIVKSIKAVVSIPIQMHCHCTSGMAEMAYLKAAEAGLDIMDCALSTLSQGTSQPPTESMVATFEGTEHDTKLDLEELTHLADYFGEVRKKYAAFEGNVKVDAGVLLHQVPGGMISNLVSQLREQGAVDKLRDVLDEIPAVRADLGYPPLVTPTSQIVGTQAVLNALYGERYKQVTKETRGRRPRPVRPDAGADQRRSAARRSRPDETPITGRPADVLEPELEKAREEAGDLAQVGRGPALVRAVPAGRAGVLRVARARRRARRRADRGDRRRRSRRTRHAAATPRTRTGNGHGHAHSPWKIAGPQPGDEGLADEAADRRPGVRRPARRRHDHRRRQVVRGARRAPRQHRHRLRQREAVRRPAARRPLPDEGPVKLLVDAKEYEVELKGQRRRAPEAEGRRPRRAPPAARAPSLSQMTGRVIRVDVEAGRRR